MTFPLPASLLYGFLTKRFFSLSSGHIAFIYHCFGKLHNIRIMVEVMKETKDEINDIKAKART